MTSNLFAASFLFCMSVLCGSCEWRDSIDVVYTVKGWPKEGVKLRILPSLRGDTGKSQTLDQISPSMGNDYKFAIHIDQGQAADGGTLNIEAIVEDKDGCYIAGALNHTDLKKQSYQPLVLKLNDYVAGTSNLKQCMGSPVVGSDNWYQMHPLAAGKNLNAVWGDRPDNQWAVGNDGTVLRWTGERWLTVRASVTGNFSTVWGDGSGHVWAAGSGGICRQWNGYSWTNCDLTGGNGILKIWVSTGNDIWAVSESGSVWKRSNNAWTESLKGGPLKFSAIWGADDNNIWAVGQQGSIAFWNGSTWTPQAAISSEDLVSIHGTGIDNIWAGGSGGKVFRHTSGGWKRDEQWQAKSTIQAIYCNIENQTPKCWVADASDIFRWEKSQWDPKGLTASVSGFSGIGSDLWAVGAQGLVMHWKSGIKAVVSKTDPKMDLRAVWGTSANQIWAVGYMDRTPGSADKRGVIMEWNGWGWTTRNDSVKNQLFSIAGPAQNDAWAVGNAGLMLHWDGMEWTEQNQLSNNLKSVWVDPNMQTVYATGDQGKIWTRAVSGTGSWTAETVSDYRVDFQAIGGKGNGDVWAVGGSGGNMKAWHYESRNWVEKSMGLNSGYLYTIAQPADSNSFPWSGGTSKGVLAYCILMNATSESWNPIQILDNNSFETRSILIDKDAFRWVLYGGVEAPSGGTTVISEIKKYRAQDWSGSLKVSQVSLYGLADVPGSGLWAVGSGGAIYRRRPN